MNRMCLLLGVLLFGMAACRIYPPVDGSRVNVRGRLLPSDAAILAKVYDTLYQVPDYFYVDERADTDRSYSVYHVKDSSTSYELCTNDYDQALEWEAADNESRAVNGYYVDTYENDRYFEIIRELSYPDGIGNISDATSPGFARVFKCSYADRDGVDRNLRDGYAGILNVRPLSESGIRMFTEYMWQFTFFWPQTKKVLESFAGETDSAYEHTLLLALASKLGLEQCDLIDIVDWTFSINKDSGQMYKEFKVIYSLNARLVRGVPETCQE